MVHNLSLASTKAIIVADSEGKKIFAKYYSQDHASLKDLNAFEKKLFEKTQKTPGGEIIMLDGLVVVYKCSLDIFIYLVSAVNENEILLFSALQSYYEALNLVYKAQVEKRLILDAPDIAFLALDETFEEGILIESDPNLIAARVTKMRPEDDLIAGFKIGGLNEQTLTQAFSMAKEQIARSLMK